MFDQSDDDQVLPPAISPRPNTLAETPTVEKLCTWHCLTLHVLKRQTRD